MTHVYMPVHIYKYEHAKYNFSIQIVFTESTCFIPKLDVRRKIGICKRNKAKNSAECLELVAEAVLKIKMEFREAYIIIGVDLNNRSLEDAVADFNDVTVLDSPPTRGDAKLDIAACNFGGSIAAMTLSAPLETDDGQSRSDHMFLSYDFALKHKHDFRWVKYRVRTITDRSIQEYDEAMRKADWATRDGESAQQTTERLHKNIIDIVNKHLPWRNFKIRSTDDPWIDEPMRKKIRQRKEVFKRDQGRSKDWRELKAVTNNIIRNLKKKAPT